MQIIFIENKDDIDKKYITLELESFPDLGGDSPKTAYCILPMEAMLFVELGELQKNMSVHQVLIDALKIDDLETAAASINFLMGKFNGELDSFYEAMITRYDLIRQ